MNIPTELVNSQGVRVLRIAYLEDGKQYALVVGRTRTRWVLQGKVTAWVKLCYELPMRITDPRAPTDPRPVSIP